MYDLLNTHARLSRQKEHLLLPKRHTLHPGAWLFRVLFVKRYWVFLALTETLGTWGGSELAGDVQSVVEDAQHLRTLGTLDQTLGDAILSLGASRKMVSPFPCYLGAALTFFCAHAAAWLFAVEENQNLTRSTPWAPLYSVSTAVSSAGAVQRSAPFCQWALCSLVGCSWGAPQPVSVSCAAGQAGGLVKEHPDVGAFPPEEWQRKAAVCVSCPSPKLRSSAQAEPSVLVMPAHRLTLHEHLTVLGRTK